MKRNASAKWQGDLKTGKGTVSTDSGVLSETQYSFSTRFENGKGTNPEELIAAAHAGCFTMEKVEAGWTVTGVHLSVTGKVPKADAASWEKATAAAKAGCPISRLLNATITMDAKLEN